MPRFIFLFLLLTCIFSSANARTIRGEVMSSADSTVVAGASCRLLADGNAVTAVSADAEGRFTLECDNRGALTLEVSMVGFTPTQILIESGAKNINIGSVYLDEGLQLDGITVTATNATTSRGRSIIYPSVADVKASGTSISLFQKLPLAGLETNPINRTLSVDGGTPVILIDGVPSTIDDINGLQPKDIEKIEFTRFTPARYADSGKRGLISITLKQRTDGGQIYLWARSAVATAFVDGNVRASYHQGPSQFTLAYSPSWRNYQKVYDNKLESFIAEDFIVDIESHDRNPFYYHYHPINLKYDYKPSAKTLFSATFNIRPNYNKRRLIGETSDSELGTYSNYNDTYGKDFSPSLDLFLRHDFNDRNSLEAQVVGTMANNDYRRANNYSFADGSEESYLVDVDSRRRSLISEVSYIHDFNDDLQLSAGYQNTVSRSTNHYETSDFKPVLTENNNYLYARLGWSVNKVYLSLSSGAKLFWMENDDNRRHFIRNISSAQLHWSISGKWSLAAGFSYTPSIPSLSALTDYPQQLTPYLFSNGNPDLKVANSFLYQLMPQFRYKKFNTSLLMNYSNVSDGMMDEVLYLGDGHFLSQTINARRMWNASGSLNMRLSDIAGFGVNLTLKLGHSEVMNDNWSHHLTSFSANASLWWNKGPFTITYWRKLPGKYLSGSVVAKDENGDALQLDYTPNQHWTIGASWMYMFDRKGTRYPSWDYSPTNPGYNERHISNNANMIVLSASYSADFGSIFRTGSRRLNNTDTTSSLLKL
ncbi:MAG: hypothetical protein K2M55_06220 [Muribaculaceae bacterium]|nr:hypothetical protein [Muribaculaceae bacterium]